MRGVYAVHDDCWRKCYKFSYSSITSLQQRQIKVRAPVTLCLLLCSTFANSIFATFSPFKNIAARDLVTPELIRKAVAVIGF